MKMKNNLAILLSLSALLIAAQTGWTQGKFTIAVLNLEAKNVGQETAEAVADILSTELFNSQRFNVIERQAITRILEEQKLQMTGITDMGEAVVIGKMLNVEKIMIGSVSRLGDSYIINTRLVDVKTGALDLAQKATSTTGESGLAQAISDLVDNISQKVQIEGSIIRIKGDLVLIDLGMNHGILTSQELAVMRLGDVVTDLGGTVIGRSEDLIGSLQVSSVKPDYSETSVGVFKLPFRVGDKVRVSTTPIKIKQAEIPKAVEEKPKQPKKQTRDKKPGEKGTNLEPPPVF